MRCPRCNSNVDEWEIWSCEECGDDFCVECSILDEPILWNEPILCPSCALKAERIDVISADNKCITSYHFGSDEQRIEDKQ